MADLETLKQDACRGVDERRALLLAIAREIHAVPELAFEERHAAALLVRALQDAGLPVEAPAYGLETAFESRVGRDGPTVALLAEYDALPGLGHACGHNLIATATLGAGLALAALGSRLPGRLRVLGTPAEEQGGGKELLARAGAFDDVDAALMVHPAGVDLVTMPTLALAEVDVVYHGRPAHASAMPERGVNALDALVAAYQAIAMLRQHIRPTERIHGIITEGGQAPNVVPERAAGRFYVRARNAEELAALKQRVAGCFRAGAEATGATSEISWRDPDYLELRTNWPLAGRYQANAEALGRVFFPFDKLPSSAMGTTDMGNVSHRVPAIHPMIAAAPMHCTIHAREFAEHAGSPLGEAAALDGAKALAMTALDFWCDAELRRETRAQFEASRST
ncbi:M20 family metallopeptidase [Myxococcota bacterium]|nr:M20 family metallopeptidase [Myxococcota bacterium]MCZ7618095.1 M20 family metallopeptidase [Myxococcota bacterium]